MTPAGRKRRIEAMLSPRQPSLPSAAREAVRLFRRQHLSPEALAAFQDEAVAALVRHAWERVPYYRELFGRAGIDPRSVRGRADLRHIPLTRKEDLRAAGDGAYARGFDPAHGATSHTSGTTGVPLTVCRSRNEVLRWALTELRSAIGAGFRPADHMVRIGTRVGARTFLFQRAGLFRVTAVSPALSLDDQSRRIRETQPTVLWGPPAELQALREAHGGLQHLVRPRVVITSADVLEPELRHHLEADVGAETFDFYGAVEVGRIAVECRAHEGLHVAADTVVVDVEADGEAEGRVVVTALEQYAMPIIRYDLGDACRVLTGPCRCGSALPRIDRLIGRIAAMIVLPSGRRVTYRPLALALRAVPWIDAYRIVQERDRRLAVRILPAMAVDDSARGRLAAELESLLEEPMTIAVECGDHPDLHAEARSVFTSRVG